MTAFTRLLIAIGFYTASALTWAEPVVIGRGDGQYPPFEWTENNTLTGIHVDLVREAAEQLKLDIAFRSLPWSRALKALEAGQISALTFMGKNVEREQYTLYLDGNVLSHAELSLLRKRSATPFTFDGRLESLEGRNIATHSGYSYGQAFDQSTLFQKTEAKSYEQILTMVLRHRVDFGIVNRVEFTHQFRDDPRLNDIEFLSPTISDEPNYLGFSRKGNTKDIAMQFAERIERIRSSSRYAEILKRYGLDER